MRPCFRHAAFKSLVGGGWPFPGGGLSPPPAMGSALLLPPPWAALLRLVLQQVRQPNVLGFRLKPAPSAPCIGSMVYLYLLDPRGILLRLVLQQVRRQMRRQSAHAVYRV